MVIRRTRQTPPAIPWQSTSPRVWRRWSPTYTPCRSRMSTAIPSAIPIKRHTITIPPRTTSAAAMERRPLLRLRAPHQLPPPRQRRDTATLGPLRSSTTPMPPPAPLGLAPSPLTETAMATRPSPGSRAATGLDGVTRPACTSMLLLPAATRAQRPPYQTTREEPSPSRTRISSRTSWTRRTFASGAGITRMSRMATPAVTRTVTISARAAAGGTAA